MSAGKAAGMKPMKLKDIETSEQKRIDMGDSELNVEVIAAEMGLSRVQLYRKVKALTDASPVEMIRMSRLNRAKILLSKGDRNVSEVAYEVGFSSPSYFSKCYKYQFGHLPAEEMKNGE